MKKITAMALCLVLGVSLMPGSALGGTDEVIVTRLTTEAEVAAPPEEVWSYMTAGENLVSWCPYWNQSANASIDLDEVGDVLEFADDWGSVGRSVVTYLAPSKEIRIVHEPDSGSYICQSKLTLEPTKNGTRVVYTEQYTDESDASSRRETAAGMEAAMQKTLRTLKEGIHSGRRS